MHLLLGSHREPFLADRKPVCWFCLGLVSDRSANEPGVAFPSLLPVLLVRSSIFLCLIDTVYYLNFCVSANVNQPSNHFCRFCVFICSFWGSQLPLSPSFSFAPAAAPSSLLPFLPSSSPPPPPQSSTRPPPQLPYLLEPAAQAAIASQTLVALTTATSARHSVRCNINITESIKTYLCEETTWFLVSLKVTLLCIYACMYLCMYNWNALFAVLSRPFIVDLLLCHFPWLPLQLRQVPDK